MNKIIMGVGFLLGLALILIIVFFSLLDIDEQRDLHLTRYLVNITAQDIYKYKLKYGVLPKSLSEAGTKDTYCEWFKCAQIKYSTDTDGRIYIAATLDARSFISYFYSDMKPKSISSDGDYLGGSWGIAFRESYSGDRQDLPIYRKRGWSYGGDLFATPSSWPRF